MDALELLDLIEGGESSTVQFKERVTDAYRIGQAMVAFANSRGGTILIGVNDKTGKLNGLSYQEIQTTNQLLSNAADNNVNPALYIETETVKIESDRIVVAHIREGISKPMMDNKGTIGSKMVQTKDESLHRTN